MDEQQLAAAAFQFLRRVQLSGDEAPTLMAVMNWLSIKAGPERAETPEKQGEEEPKPKRRGR